MVPNWYQLAVQQIGTQEIAGPKEEKRINEYHGATAVPSKSEVTPWCGSFLAWLMRESGIKYNRVEAARALSWLEWGKGIKNPFIGAVAVLPRGRPGSGTGHVTMFSGWVDESKTEFYGLGGNQPASLDQVKHTGGVSIQKYKTSDVLGWRWPAEVAIPTVEKRWWQIPELKGAVTTAIGAGAIIYEAQNEVIDSLNKAQEQYSSGTIIGLIGSIVVIVALVAMVATRLRINHNERAMTRSPIGSE